MSNQVIIGVDEAGRGCLAGPVVVAAVYLPVNFDIKGVKDSKKITSESKREKIFENIIRFPGVKYSVKISDNLEIDKLNILNSTLKCMGESVNELSRVLGIDNKNILAKIDGNKIPKNTDIKCEYVISGDSKILEISAASIIAKVTRDNIMIELSKKYPEWNFDKNKGYPNKFHLEKVKEGNFTEIHRLTFNPLKEFLLTKKKVILI